MRQMLIQMPQADGDRVVQIVRDANAVNVARLDGTGTEDPTDIVIAYVPNRDVETVIQKLEQVEGAKVSFFPQPAITLEPSQSRVASHATSVQPLSPVEVFLGGLQSIGAWKGFVAYAAAAGVVVWIGLFTNSAFLLVAAMLIAPFAGPAMNAALATARGDGPLLGRSLLRYFASIIVTVLMAFILSLVLNQRIVTTQMAETSSVSEIAVMLPLVAGAAGALNLVQSNRSSLVSAAATGMLVAAALAPPAGLVGMTAAIGRWDMAIDGAFLLLLQLVGINVSGALVFRLFGVTARESVYERGKKWLFPVALGVSILLLAGLLAWQFASPPNLQRKSIAQNATAQVHDIVEASDLAQLVEVSTEFTRPDISGQNTLVSHIYVQRRPGVEVPAEEIRQQLTQEIQQRILSQGWNVTPLVDVTVLEPPSR